MPSERIREIRAAEALAVNAMQAEMAAFRESERPTIDKLRAFLETEEGTRALRIAAIKVVGHFDGLSRREIRFQVNREKAECCIRWLATQNLRETTKESPEL